METHQCCSDDMVMEILTYLPAKSLMRFKCVSKAWNTLIKHPTFARSHYARSKDRLSATRILFQLLKTNPNDEQYRDDAETRESEGGFSLQLDYSCEAKEMTICTNHCNGLVCLYSYKDCQLYLYNVTTREIQALPQRLLSYQFEYPMCPKMFLGFDQVTQNYKLLCFFSPPEGRRAKRAKLLTLGVTSSSWRKIRNSLKPDPCDFSRECVFLDGILYWTGCVKCRAYFNFSKEKFGYASPPCQHHPNNIINAYSMRTALWGKLSVCYSYLNHGPPVLVLYNHVNRVRITAERVETIEVGTVLFGAETINDKTKKSHVLATASVISAAASLPTSSSPCCLRFVSSFVDNNNNNNMGPRIKLTFVSCFVENIIPLTSLLV